jgi:hypothetical protein
MEQLILRIVAVVCLLVGTIGTGQVFAQQPSPMPTNLTPTEAPPQVTKMISDNNKVFLKVLPPNFKYPEDDAGKVLLREYGAVFAASGGAVTPKKVIFRDESEVSAFQSSVESSTEMIGGMSMRLQKRAMTALLAAISEAAVSRLTITPRDTDAASRSYFESVSLWLSRVEPGLQHWISKRKITPEQATLIRSMPIEEQVSEILRLEKKGIYFARDLNKSILYSVAPPGTSQHLSMLAFDVKEHDDVRVRSIMTRHGWHQTVVSDLPHFTYLGLSEDKLTSRGLKMVINYGRKYWVPDLAADVPLKVIGD